MLKRAGRVSAIIIAMDFEEAKGKCGAYRLLREIGRGGHGTVFLAEGPGGRAAVKVCRRPDDPSRAEAWERERRGWRLFSRIPPCAGLVRVFDMGGDDDTFWVAMEAADPEIGGGADPGDYRPRTLLSAATAEVALPLGRVLATGDRLCAALDHLQRHHLLHRDLKPGNILYVRGAPVIADAGLVVDDREAASLVGTPGYAPPENHGTPQGDVFSLGRTLWRIGTGRQPEETGCAPCQEADTSDPDFPAFLELVKRAMSDSPDRRFRSAKAFRKVIARLRRRRAARRALRFAIPILAVACAVLALALAWSLGRRRGRQEAVPVPSPQGAVATEPDPLDDLRDMIKTGKVHILTPEEAQRQVDEINAELKSSLGGLQKEIGKSHPAKSKK